jgi:hypothetical protein
MPDAGRTRGALRAKKLRFNARKQRQGSRNNRHSLRDGVNTYNVLSSETGL